MTDQPQNRKPFVSEYEELYSLIGSKSSSDSLSNIALVEQASCLSVTTTSSNTELSSANIETGLVEIETGRMPVPQGSELEITYRGDLPHWIIDGAIYFITFNTWEKLGLTPEAQKVVLDACLFFQNQRYRIYTVVIMPDHVHMMIQPLEREPGEYWSLANILHSIKSYSSKQIPKVMKHIGIIWQDSRYDRIVRDDREFQFIWEYIRQNPTKASLCKPSEIYPFLWQNTDFDPSLLDFSFAEISDSSEKLDSSLTETGKMPVPQNLDPLVVQASCLFLNKIKAKVRYIQN